MKSQERNRKQGKEKGTKATKGIVLFEGGESWGEKSGKICDKGRRNVRLKGKGDNVAESNQLRVRGRKSIGVEETRELMGGVWGRGKKELAGSAPSR